jgi:hypothetical protein
MQRVLLVALVGISTGCHRPTDNPFPAPIESEQGIVIVGLENFETLPYVNDQSPRPMLLLHAPESHRIFVNDMWGPLYVVGRDGRVARYLDIADPEWGIALIAKGRERGFQSFALHPHINQPGSPGFGKLYTWSDTADNTPTPDFVPGGGRHTHHTVLLEWTARDPSADRYDGGPPRELLRLEQPFSNHNGGHLAFNPLAAPDDSDFGMLYVGVADGGGGGDPLGLAQDRGSAFGKILRIDPLGSNSRNGQYGIPADNPFAGRTVPALGEIYAYGLRNPQRFGWDPMTGIMLVADIGQNAIEELSLVTAGANLGWNAWEGSFRYVDRTGVAPRAPRSDPGITYPVAEYDRVDPLLQSRVAITGVVVVRADALPALRDRVVFGDLVSGEVFHIPADPLPTGGQDAMRRVLFRTNDAPARC